VEKHKHKQKDKQNKEKKEKEKKIILTDWEQLVWKKCGKKSR
jgi:hypothetical protein